MSGRRSEAIIRFGIVDYFVFGFMLFISAATGIYFGCKGEWCASKEEQTVTDYLTGSRKLKPFPVAMSLIASYISGVTLLGTPSEIYIYGNMYSMISIVIFVAGFVVATVYLPVFFVLNVASSYEYLQYRFNRSVRTMASVIFLMDEILFLPMVIYVPSLAFNQVSGVNVHFIGFIVCMICIFYTYLGGLKAVVWTDTWQIMAMFLAVIVVIIMGTIHYGGMAPVYVESRKGGRLNFSDFDMRFSTRYTYLSVLLGGFTYWTSFNSVNQTMVQRYTSLPTLRLSRISILMFLIGTSGFVFMCCYCGNLIFAYYKDCDPSASGRITRDDQILALYVMETIGYLHGIPGLFIAGVFGAGLSSLSVILNSTAIVVLEDIVKGFFHLSITERAKSVIAKTVELILGMVALGLVFVVERLGGVLEVATALSAIAAGTTFGIFTLGMLFPWTNSSGVIIGSIAGVIMTATVSFGNQYTAASGLVVDKRLPISVDKCEDFYGISMNFTERVYPDSSKVFPLFNLSYLWISSVGVLTVLIVGVVASFCTGKTDTATLDPDLISPICHWMLPKEAFANVGATQQRKFSQESSLREFRFGRTWC